MRARDLAAMLGVALIAFPALAQDPPPRPAHRGDSAGLTDSPRPPARPEPPKAEAPKGEPPPQPAAQPGTAPMPPANAAPETASPADAVPDRAPPAWKALAEGDLSYRFCLLNLDMLGVGYRPAAPVTSPEDPDCGIARPVQVDRLQPGVAIAGGAVMRCDTARRLALWLRAEAQPAAALLPGAPTITEILPGSTYQCRARVGGSSEKLSEHALGNAFDVAALRFSNGAEIEIAPRGNSGTIEEAFQKAIRYGACLYFTTVLGPGSNAAHDNHLHFDAMARKNGWRVCE